MKTFYEKQEVWFAVAWIILYCALTIPIRGRCGDESPAMLLALAAIGAGILAFVKAFHLEETYGLVKWRGSARDYGYFLPMLVLMTGNLWGGFGMDYGGTAQVFATLSMLLVGFVEEILFRGFLFRALLKEDPAPVAITISAVTFGIGHIVNLLAGQASLETVVQVFFAIAWGFLFTMVFYKSGSLLPCIVVHGLVDVFAKFTNPDSSTLCGYVYVTATIVLSLLYCLYLRRKPTALE